MQLDGWEGKDVMEERGALECRWGAGGRGKGLFGLVAYHYTYHSFLEMTEPSV